MPFFHLRDYTQRMLGQSGIQWESPPEFHHNILSLYRSLCLCFSSIMSSSWVNYLGDDLLNNGWISSVLNFTEENKITVLTLIFFILAVALATRNPAEIHRRGIWIIPVDFPWTWRALHSGKLSVINALKQQTWQVI